MQKSLQATRERPATSQRGFFLRRRAATARTRFVAEREGAHDPHGQGFPESGWGNVEFLPWSDPAISMMCCDRRNRSVRFIHNPSNQPTELEVKAKAIGKHGDRLMHLLFDARSDAAADADAKGRQTARHSILLEPYRRRRFCVGELDQLLKCMEVSP